MSGLLSKWKKTPESARSAIVFVLSTFIIKGIVFFTTPIFTRLMDSAQYGLISTYNSWSLIIEVFALLGLTSAGLFNVGLNDNRDCCDKYVASVLILCNLCSVVVFGLLFLSYYLSHTEFILPTSLLFAMLINLLFNPAQIFWITRQKYEYKYRLAFLITILSTVLSQVVSIICVTTSTSSELGAVKIWSTTIVSTLFNLPIYIYILVKGKTIVNFSLWRRILIVAIPLIPHYLAQHIMTGADRIMLSNMVSDSATGIYSVVANIGMIATLIWSAMNSSLVPYTYDKLNNGDFNPIAKLVTCLVFFYAFLCFSIVLVAPEIMAILAPEEYYEGINAIAPIVCVAFLSSLYNVYANIEFYYKHTIFISVATMVATVVNVAANYLLIPKFSYNGAAYATLISNLVLILMHYVGYKRSAKTAVYNDKHILLIFVGCIVCCEALSLLYGYYAIIRYAIFAIICVVMIIKRKAIIGMIKITKNKRNEEI